MKNIFITFSILFFFNMPFCFSQANFFYYYQDQPQYLNLDNKNITLITTLLKSEEELRDELQQFTGLAIDRVRNTISQFDFQLVFSQDLSESDLFDVLNQINTLSYIDMAGPVLLYDNIQQGVTNLFTVRFREQVTEQQIETLNDQYDVEIMRRKPNRIFLMKVDKSTELNGLSVSNIYYDSGLVEWAEPNFIYYDGSLLHASVNDTYWGSQWAHKNTGQSVPTGASTTYGFPANVNGTPDADMDVDLAWDINAGGSSSIKVAIIDSGTDLDHEDLQANVGSGRDEVDDDATADDGEGHGTCCSGIVAAVADNGKGVAGIAYNSTIIPVRVFDNSGSTTNAWLADGINWAWQTGEADILSNSWGGGSPANEITNAINNAKTKGRGDGDDDGNDGDLGCVVVFSSGNNGRDPVNYPAYLDDVISVGASNMYDQKVSAGSQDYQHWWGANYGDAIDVVAPTIVYTTDIAGSGGYSSGNYEDVFNGTSAACPNVAGVAALILAEDNTLTSDEVQSILESTADKIEKFDYDANGWNKHVGYGRVNAYQALRAAQGTDYVYPLMRHTMFQPTTSTSGYSVSAEITDDAGVGSGSGQPLVYYRTDAGSGFGDWNSLTDSDGPSGNTYDFSIPGQSWGTQVEYYIAAQDASSQDNSGSFPFGATGSDPPGSSATADPLTYRVGHLVTRQYTSSDVSKTISYGTVYSTLNISESLIIADVNVKIDIDHAYLDDINVTLESPSGTMTCLTSENGGSGDDYDNTVFDDEASTPISDGSPPYAGTFKPEYALWVFDGEDAQGEWRLFVYDNYLFTNGTLQNWSLTFTFHSDEEIYISEISDHSSNSSAEFCELYNNTGSDIDLNNYKLVRCNSGGDAEYVFDFGSDESGTSGTVIPAKGYLIIARGATQSAFESAWSVTLGSNVNYNTGNSNLQFGESTAKRWKFFNSDGSADVADGVLLDDTQTTVAGANNCSYQDTPGNWKTTSASNATPGSAHSDQSLPVELSSFTALGKENRVELRWSTESEAANLGFIIKRSMNKEGEYEEIASYKKHESLKGQGTVSYRSDYQFVDNMVIAENTYWYKLVDIDINGRRQEHGPVSAIPLADGSLARADFTVPEQFALHQNYPNPFNPQTTIPVDIPASVGKSVEINVIVFDLLGRKVKTLYRGTVSPGRYRIGWDGSSDAQTRLPSGMYIYSIVAQNFRQTKKMVLLQ